MLIYTLINAFNPINVMYVATLRPTLCQTFYFHFLMKSNSTVQRAPVTQAL